MPPKTSRSSSVGATEGGGMSSPGFWPSWRKKPLFATLLTLFMVVAIAFMATLSIWATMTALGVDDPTPSERVVTVQGDGTVTVLPDKATVTFGVESKGGTVAEAQAANTTTTASLIEKIKALGVAAEDIQTSGYNVYEEEYWNETTQRYDSVGWIVYSDVSITMRDLTIVSSVLETASTAGITNVYGLYFSAEETQDIIQQAREEAIQEAEAHINQIASQLGVKVDAVVDYQEWTSGGGGYYPYYDYAYAETGFGGAAPAVEAGSEEITVSVSITYSLKK